MNIRLEVQLHEIATITANRYKEVPHIGVLGGKSGIALFQFYCSKYFNQDIYADNGLKILEDCIENINKGYINSPYCGGLAGFGWVIQHLHDQEFLDLPADEILSSMDTLLLQQMRKELSNKYLDFLHGAIGYGFYFLKRYKGTKNDRLKNQYVSCLTELINGIKENALFENNTIFWKSTLDARVGNKGCNLSLAHGMAGIINFLVRMATIPSLKNDCNILLRGASNFIVDFYNKSNKECVSLFPSWIEEDSIPEYDSRLAWCYGDLGIGKSLELAAMEIENNELEKQALEILEESAKRVDASNTRVIDAGICHGSFGNFLFFNEINNQHPSSKFREAMDFWINDGLSKCTDNPKEPYLQWQGKDLEWRFELNVLEGVSGIGLCIIDYLSDEKNNWSECLLLC
ncbi:lanthionine synthetase C family protein [Maribacter sp. 2307UL18-2]|uniref:lanthionine synthetase C family protein n=1 Tax=Maribacter sp. 2307UL18-2 TaxID=3386274 RepID=UPI0039BD389E